MGARPPLMYQTPQMNSNQGASENVPCVRGANGNLQVIRELGYQKRDFGANLALKGSKTDQNGTQNGQNGAERVPKGSQSDQNGAKRVPKGSQRATKMHIKINARKRSPKGRRKGARV